MQPGGSRQRIQALDVLRGIVIVLMVLDHSRDFLHESSYLYDPLDASRTTLLVYLTRWVTHFCAPTFVFLAGVSGWLQLARGKSRLELARLLLTRGLWLIVLENTVIGFGWSFHLPFLIFLQVIWAIGCSMIVLAGLLWLPRALVLSLGVAIIAGHNLLSDSLAHAPGASGILWTMLNVGGVLKIGGVDVLDAYPVLAWTGVMCFGYGVGPLFTLPAAQRDRLLIRIGSALIVTFLVLRYFNLYGDPHPWAPRADALRSAMALFNVEKYPPSLLYVCATLGPVFVAIPFIERWRGWAPRFLLAFGSVPFFAYVLHIYTLHCLAILAELLLGGNVAGQFDVMRSAVFAPEHFQGSMFPLYVTYAVWLTTLALLYPLCRWFADLKRRRSDWWLSYL